MPTETSAAVFDDHLAKHDEAYFADLLRLELELCYREPYNRVGQFWQLVATRV